MLSMLLLEYAEDALLSNFRVALKAISLSNLFINSSFSIVLSWFTYNHLETLYMLTDAIMKLYKYFLSVFSIETTGKLANILYT